MEGFLLVSVVLSCGVCPTVWKLCEISVTVDLSDILWYFSEHRMRVSLKHRK